MNFVTCFINGIAQNDERYHLYLQLYIDTYMFVWLYAPNIEANAVI